MLEGLKDYIKKKEKINRVTLIKESNGCLCVCLNLHSHIKGLITLVKDSGSTEEENYKETKLISAKYSESGSTKKFLQYPFSLDTFKLVKGTSNNIRQISSVEVLQHCYFSPSFLPFRNRSSI